MKPKTKKIIVFTDLDGTLLDDTYSYAIAKPIIQKLLALDTSVVLSSSKTRAEIELYRDAFEIRDPFVVENGSAIFIPNDYFKHSYENARAIGDYQVIELGMNYFTVREKLAHIAKTTSAKIVGFGDMTPKQIADESGLPLHLARFAKQREYDEAFKIVDGNEKKVLQAITAIGLCYTKGGKFFHALGNSDKGKAVKVLKNLYLQDFEAVVTVGVGDSANDLPMLSVVDKSFMVQTITKETLAQTWEPILNSISELSKTRI